MEAVVDKTPFPLQNFVADVVSRKIEKPVEGNVKCVFTEQFDLALRRQYRVVVLYKSELRSLCERFRIT